MIQHIEWPKSKLNKKVVIIAISVAIVISIIGLTTVGSVKQNSTNNLPLVIDNNSKIPLISENNSKIALPSVAIRHNIEVNLNESMHFSAH